MFVFFMMFDSGIHISQDTPTNTRILEIAPKCLITIEVARNSDIGRRITQSGYHVRSVEVMKPISPKIDPANFLHASGEVFFLLLP